MSRSPVHARRGTLASQPPRPRNGGGDNHDDIALNQDCQRLCGRMSDAGRDAGTTSGRRRRSERRAGHHPGGTGSRRPAWRRSRPRRHAHGRPRQSGDRRLGRECDRRRFARLGLDEPVVRRRELQAPVLQQGEGDALQRQAGHQLHDQHLRSGVLLRGPQALRVRLVRDAAQHDVVGQRREDDRGVPRPRRRRAVHPHAGSARVEHSEGHRPRRDRPDLPDDARRQPGAGSGEVLALPAVRPSQLGLGTGRTRSGRACLAATRTRSTTTCSWS